MFFFRNVIVKFNLGNLCSILNAHLISEFVVQLRKLHPIQKLDVQTGLKKDLKYFLRSEKCPIGLKQLQVAQKRGIIDQYFTKQTFLNFFICTWYIIKYFLNFPYLLHKRSFFQVHQKFICQNRGKVGKKNIFWAFEIFICGLKRAIRRYLHI